MKFNDFFIPSFRHPSFFFCDSLLRNQYKKECLYGVITIKLSDILFMLALAFSPKTKQDLHDDDAPRKWAEIMLNGSS